MKTLIIVRHGKSAWDNPDLKDHDRRLLPKGIKRTEKIAGFLATKNAKPDLIISSTAIRAHETAKIIAEGLNYDQKNIKLDSNIYYEGTDYLMERLYGLPNEVNAVMLIGHNPTFSHFANKFLDKQISDLPTTGTVSISFETEKWEEIDTAAKNTNFVIVPRML